MSFNGNNDLTMLDRLVDFGSRSDGMVDFRSACGSRATPRTAGRAPTPRSRSISRNCAQSAKKPNHYIWFATDMNHLLIQHAWAGCKNTTPVFRRFRAAERSSVTDVLRQERDRGHARQVYPNSASLSRGPNRHAAGSLRSREPALAPPPSRGYTGAAMSATSPRQPSAATPGLANALALRLGAGAGLEGRVP